MRPAGRERGIIVLMLLVVLALTAASALLLTDLNANRASPAAVARQTATALAEARGALLGYAAAYPDRAGVNSRTAGPGLLPCPDTRLDSNDVAGQADSPCALSSATETGLLPWRTLALPDLRDGTGAPLWYALANGYRNNPAGVVNSDTPAGLRLDNCRLDGRSIAALVLAPGAPLGGQQRNADALATRYQASHYLEEANASRGDGCFGSTTGASANDVLVAIDREALNAVMERRVLAEVLRALRRYAADPEANDRNGQDPVCLAASAAGDCDTALPWLSPWAPPASSPFAGVVGTRIGQLPLRRVGESFAAPYLARWTLASGTLTSTGVSPPSAACLRDTAQPCVVQPPGFLAGTVLRRDAAAEGASRCRWPGGSALVCERSVAVADAGGSGNTLVRHETIAFSGLPRQIQRPDATHLRREATSLKAEILPAGAGLDISMEDAVRNPAGQVQAMGASRLRLEAGAPVNEFVVEDVPLDLEVDDDGQLEPVNRASPGELPAWFVANRWQDYVLVAYSPALAPGSGGRACTAGADCLVLARRSPDGNAQTLDDVTGLVLLAGAALPSQRRSAGDPAQWFEGDNARLDGQFTEQAPDARFNDRLRRLESHD